MGPLTFNDEGVSPYLISKSVRSRRAPRGVPELPHMNTFDGKGWGYYIANWIFPGPL